tara:strand:+ start:539 stop:733 length:195 start_codon:yes stop_codon:yes gene_type:complete
MKKLKEYQIITKELLDILICPVSKGKLILDEEKSELISKKARLAYPIRNGIPIMLKEEARVIKT